MRRRKRKDQEPDRRAIAGNPYDMEAACKLACAMKIPVLLSELIPKGTVFLIDLSDIDPAGPPVDFRDSLVWGRVDLGRPFDA